MLEVLVVPASNPLPIDVCRRCQFLWFDGTELQQLPKYSPPPPRVEKPLPTEAREALAMWEIERMREQARDTAAGPDDAWQILAAVCYWWFYARTPRITPTT
jgi:Zn-finger nucleic acid-binding protein